MAPTGLGKSVNAGIICSRGKLGNAVWMQSLALTRPAANPIQFTLNKEKLKDKEKVSKEEEKERNTAAMVCSLENRDECLMCGS